MNRIPFDIPENGANGDAGWFGVYFDHDRAAGSAKLLLLWASGLEIGSSRYFKLQRC